MQPTVHPYKEDTEGLLRFNHDIPSEDHRVLHSIGTAKPCQRVQYPLYDENMGDKGC